MSNAPSPKMPVCQACDNSDCQPGNARELVILSGKGGTGKTTVLASFAALAADDAILADCDVDAANLHLVLQPERVETHEFQSGYKATIREEACICCGSCFDRCRFDAIRQPHEMQGKVAFFIDPLLCEGCGVCLEACPVNVIDSHDNTAGEWYISHTKYGPLAHAALGIAEDNSGKLVTRVRQTAKALAQQHDKNLILVDGPPGTGCPVIASLTGASAVLLVTEPTLSGLHDLQRVADVSTHFGLTAMVAINKYDLNEELTQRIADYCREHRLPLVGRIPYNHEATAAQRAGVPVVQHSDGPAAEALRACWQQTRELLASLSSPTENA